MPPLVPPPSGALWDLPVAEAPLAFVDLEMTGLDILKDRVVEICIEVTIGGERVDGLHSLVHPVGDARVGGAAHVHGLDLAALSGAPSFEALAKDVVRLLDGAVFVAHAAEWDASFLCAELLRAGVPYAIPYYLDTLVLARRAFARQSYSLDALSVALGIDRGRAHRADSDVRAMRAVFDRCVGVLAPVSVKDLWEVRIGERRARAAIVDACEAAAKYGAEVEIVYRATRKPPAAMRFVVVEVRSELDPPRVLGYQLPGRGRRELRADRILRVSPPEEKPPPHEA